MNTQSKSSPSRGHRGLSSNALPAAVFFAASLAVLLFGGERPASAQPAMPSGSDLSSWQDNGHDGKYLLKVTNGAPPAEGTSTSGVVLSDTACEPDAEGMNHCRNGIRQANGMTIHVINNHMMGRYRCLQPGETISLTGSSGGWVTATAADAGAHH